MASTSRRLSAFFVGLVAFLVLSSTNQPVHAYNDTYSLSTTVHYLMYAYASYCQAPDLQSWSCYWCESNDTEPLTVTHTFWNSPSNIFGFAGYNNHEIVVSFRGTERDSLQNWISNLNLGHTVPYKDVPDAEVHDGFYHAFQSVHDQVHTAVLTLARKFPRLPVVVTGHSLGAAIATLAAIDLAETFINVKFYVWNYASPRVGNQVFSDHVTSKIGSIWRTTNQRDVVPHLPPRVFGFHHLATEVWFPIDYVTYIVCDGSGEDENCADSLFLPDSIYDHGTYLGFSTREGGLHGC